MANESAIIIKFKIPVLILDAILQLIPNFESTSTLSVLIDLQPLNLCIISNS